MKRSIRIAQCGLAAAGVLALGYCLAVGLHARFFQERAARRFALEVRKEMAAPPAASPARLWTPPRDGAPVGRLEIPRLDLAVMVVEGVDGGDLRRAAGHIPGTALPGQPGNVAIAAHRDTFFRPLRRIRPSDRITLDTPRGAWQYRVVSTAVVRPADVRVLYPTRQDTLTLITCFPFHYIGSAPKRFVVRAQRETPAALQ